MTAPERPGPERPGPDYPPEWDDEPSDPCPDQLCQEWDDSLILVDCEREVGHHGSHSAGHGEWEWEPVTKPPASNMTHSEAHGGKHDH